MEIKHVIKNHRGVFTLIDGSQIAGLITFLQKDKDLMVIDHTEVDDQFSGQGWGRKLVHECVNYARDNNMKITPLCSFARRIFNQEPEIHDVLYPAGHK